MSRYRKGKTNLDFTEARDSKWQWHQLGRMQVCTSLQTDNHASTPPLSFLQAGCPSCRPANSVEARNTKLRLLFASENAVCWCRSERDVVKAGLRWINADRGSRAGHVGHVIGRCVNFDRLHPQELVWLSTAEPYVLDDPTVRQAIYSANWSALRPVGHLVGSVAEWLACWTLGAEGSGFKSQPQRCLVTVLGKLFTPIVPLFTKQRNW